MLRMPRAVKDPERAEYVNRGAYVGVRIILVEAGYHPRENIVSVKGGRAQILTGRK